MRLKWLYANLSLEKASLKDVIENKRYGSLSGGTETQVVSTLNEAVAGCSVNEC